MGAVRWRVVDYMEFLSEIVGYKAGVAMSDSEFADQLADMPGYDGFAGLPRKTWIRTRSEIVQSTVAWLLFRLGNIETPITMPPLFDVVRKYLDKPRKLKLLMTVGDELFRFTRRALERAEKRGEKAIDPTPLIKQVERKHGVRAAQMAVEMVLSLDRSLHIMPWSRIRMVDWKDTVRLRDLFKNESLTTHYGFFLDQRFIDFLSNNFDRIDEINWRKFEGLAGEFFTREGYHVEMGRGRADQGVDLRVWPDKERATGPPLVIVQCKRQKDKVEQVVVKALWADVVHERARSGLIVTTSRLAPSSETVRKARSYPVEQADRDTLRRWIREMRTPALGITLTE